ncbi:MAG: T9SS type A sorting domain-containing protein, partial [Bacteroidota bacterium]
AHREDWADNQQIDAPNAAVFSWPARGNPFFGAYHDFNSDWSDHSAGFWDQNGDGLYNPDQGDYPILELQGCGNVGTPSEMHWSYFGDGGLHTQSGMEPLPVQIRQTVFSFACSDHDLLNRTVFVLYRIEYEGVEILDSVHIGVFTDFSIGYPVDDYLGFIPDSRTAYAYNAENTDEDCGDILGYGAMPPSVSTTILRAPLDYGNPSGVQPIFPSSMVSLSYDPNDSSYPMGGADYYALLSGSYRDGTPIENGGYTLNGNPNNPNDWSELQSGATPGNRRSLMALGPMQLNPGEFNQLLVAYTFFQGGNHLENVQSIYEEVGQLLDLSENCFIPNCETTVGINHTPTLVESALTYPNPTDAALTIEFANAQHRVLRLYNTMGQRIREGTSSGRQYVLRTENLPSGAYYLQISTDQEESQIQRILVTH